MSEKHDRGAALRRRNPPRHDRDHDDHGERTPKGVRYLVGRVTDLRRGTSMKFLMPVRGADEECFVINFRGHLHAYVNRCRHVPMAMDWVDNQFFAEEGRYLRAVIGTSEHPEFRRVRPGGPPTPSRSHGFNKVAPPRLPPC